MNFFLPFRSQICINYNHSLSGKCRFNTNGDYMFVYIYGDYIFVFVVLIPSEDGVCWTCPQAPREEIT